jgi:hypothetical protein
MIYNNYSCPKCGKLLEFLVPKGPKGSIGVGEPFLICPKCNSYILKSDLANEWELMTKEQKSKVNKGIVLTVIYLGGLWSGFGSILVLGLLFPQFLNLTVTLPTFILFSTLGSIAHYSIYKKRITKEIQESNNRMSDPNYRQTLQQLGLLTKKNPILKMD